MDVFSLAIVRSSLTTEHDRVMFDHLFDDYFVGNPAIRHTFDTLADTGIVASRIVSDLLYAAVFGKNVIVGYSNECHSLTDVDGAIDSKVIGLISCIIARDFREPTFCRTRLNWESYIATLVREGAFYETFRMDLASFHLLTYYTSPFMNEPDEAMSRLRTAGADPIYPELALFCALRYLAGGKFQDIRSLCGIARSTFYALMWHGIDAINKCEELKIKFPQTLEECDAAARAFKDKSSHGVMNKCVGAVDGWLCQIRCPRHTETADVMAYFSGHYSMFGLNIQAVSDANGKCIFLAVCEPGVCPDGKAYDGSTLALLGESLPYGYYIVGDCAYIASNKLLTPYSGRSMGDRSKDSYNFHLSQLRIQIEQLFGMLCNKFLIFETPLKIPLMKMAALIHCAFRLHNFCVDQRVYAVRFLNYNPVVDEPNYMPYLDHANNGHLGHSPVRESIAAMLEDHGIFRPQYNRARNNV